MKKVSLVIFNYLLTAYIIISTSFFYKQYLAVVQVNNSKYSDFIYFLLDNNTLLILFSFFFISIMFNLFYILHYWIFTSREEIIIKKTVGYNNQELILDYLITYMKSFISTFAIAGITTIPLQLNYNLPIIGSLIMSFLMVIVFLTIIVSLMLAFILRKSTAKGGKFSKYFKTTAISFQISLSFLLVFVSFTLFLDTQESLSTYKNYNELENAWVVMLDHDQSNVSRKNLDEDLQKYKEPIVKKFSYLYEKHSDQMVIYYQGQSVHEEIGTTFFLNEQAFQLNNMDMSIFEESFENEQIPIILKSEFKDIYRIGDEIKRENNNFVVTKIFDDTQKKFLSPIDFTEDSSESYNFALFNDQALKTELYYENDNLLNTLYFVGINEEEIKDIVSSLSTEYVTYDYASIVEVQKNNYDEKKASIASYFLVGVVNFVFSFLGFICIVYMDIYSSKEEISVMKLIGYTDRFLYLSYSMYLLVIYLSSYVIAQILAYQSLRFSLVVSITIIVIVVILHGVTSLIAKSFIKNIKTVEVIGGENA